MDVLVAIVVRFNLPITVAMLRKMDEIMADFGFTPESRSVYRYAGDPEMLDRMTVVDDPS